MSSIPPIQRKSKGKEAAEIIEKIAFYKTEIEFIEQTEKDIRCIEHYIRSRSDDPNFTVEDKIVEYQKLVDLNPQNQQYQTKVNLARPKGRGFEF